MKITKKTTNQPNNNNNKNRGFYRAVIVIMIIIMDGSCVTQIFPSRKLNALAHTIYANIQT